MANVTTTTANVDIDDVWAPELNRAVMLDIVVADLFEDKSSVLAGHGDTYHLVSRHNLTANTKSAGSDLTPEAITETEQTFVVSTQKAAAQEIEDIAALQSRYDIRAEFTATGSYVLARAMDSSAAALFTSTTQQVGTLGSELTDDNLLRGRQYMRDNAAPGPYVGVVSPATFNGFLKIDKFINQLYNGDGTGAAVEKAKLGSIYNTTYYESQLLSGTSPSSTGASWAKGHYFKIIQRKPTTHTWYSPLAVAWVVSMDCIYGMFEKLEPDEAAAATTNTRLWSVGLLSKK